MDIESIINSSMDSDVKDIRISHYLNDKDINVVKKYITYIEDGFIKVRVISRFNDMEKLELIPYIDDLYSRSKILKTIEDDNLLERYLMSHPKDICYEIVRVIKDDSKKIKFIDYLNDKDSTTIIENLHDENLIKKYISSGHYDKYISKALSMLNDSDFIYNYCKLKNNTSLTLNVIKLITDSKLKEKLLYTIDDPVVKEIIDMNKNEINNDVSGVLYNVDPNITFGIELEAVNKEYASNLIGVGKMLGDWKIVEDGSVFDGLEVVSPVLRFDENSLKQVKYVCDYLVNNSFITNDNCGGHVHLGFDYFKDINHFDNFMKLYSSCEDILYNISNKKETVIRDNHFLFARKLKENTKCTINHINVNKIKTLDNYVKVIRKSHNSHRDGLNIENIGKKDKNTIEFKFPNGELDFNELISNIKLFAKLFEKSKDTNLVNQIINTLDEDSKFELLNNSLFDSVTDRNIYKERYESNKTTKRF